MNIHQMVGALSLGDAVSNQIFELDRIIKDMGHTSYIFASVIAPEVRQKGRSDTEYLEYIDRREDILIYHHAITCEIEKYFLESKNKKIFIYHNITPAEYYIGYDENIYKACREGRERLHLFKESDLGVGDSEYNRQELVESGFDPYKTDVLPILVNMEKMKQVSADGNVILRYRRDDTTNILFVGRMVPNKKVEDIIKAYYYYCNCYDPTSRLFLVGNREIPKYVDQLDILISKLLLKDRVVFPGKVSLPELKSFYQIADIYLSLSEHEGFCVPLLESMYFQIPIIALNKGGVPYTLGDAGILLEETDYPLIGEIIDQVPKDDQFKQTIIRSQKERLADFSLAKVEKKFRELIDRVA